ncbi:hypothetical protein H1C71_008341, partial [Ictidomys tridecemlineatus]
LSPGLPPPARGCGRRPEPSSPAPGVVCIFMTLAGMRTSAARLPVRLRRGGRRGSPPQPETLVRDRRLPFLHGKGLASPPTPNHLRAPRWKDFGNYLFQLSCFQSRLG